VAHGRSNETAICLRFGSASPDWAIDSDEFPKPVKLEARAPFFLLKTLADMPDLPARGWAFSTCHEEPSWTKGELQTVLASSEAGNGSKEGNVEPTKPTA
jgi:hypothetical protein